MRKCEDHSMIWMSNCKEDEYVGFCRKCDKKFTSEEIEKIVKFKAKRIPLKEKGWYKIDLADYILELTGIDMRRLNKMNYVQLGSKGAKGRFKKVENYKLEEFAKLIAPGFFTTRKSIIRRINKLIRDDK